MICPGEVPDFLLPSHFPLILEQERAAVVSGDAFIVRHTTEHTETYKRTPSYRSEWLGRRCFCGVLAWPADWLTSGWILWGDGKWQRRGSQAAWKHLKSASKAGRQGKQLESGSDTAYKRLTKGSKAAQVGWGRPVPWRESSEVCSDQCHPLRVTLLMEGEPLSQMRLRCNTRLSRAKPCDRSPQNDFSTLFYIFVL